MYNIREDECVIDRVELAALRKELAAAKETIKALMEPKEPTPEEIIEAARKYYPNSRVDAVCDLAERLLKERK